MEYDPPNIPGGAQDIPPQNMPLWYSDYSELYTLNTQQREASAPPNRAQLLKMDSLEVSPTKEDWLLS